MSKLASFIVLLAIIATLGVLFYMVMSDFFVPLFLAVILVVVFHPLHDRIVARFHGRKHLAAACSTAAIMLIVMLPVVMILSFALSEAISFGSKINKASRASKAITNFSRGTVRLTAGNSIA